jgi:beta-lactam-binding protein with PASTA domain
MPTLGFGMSYADAKAQLEQLGLVVTKKAPLGEGKHDRVVDQDPLPGVRVRIGSTVTLTVV